VFPAPCPEHGCHAPASHLVDANLGGDSIEGVTAALADRGTPFVLVSGYSRKSLPPQLARAPLIQKPFDPRAVIDAVQRLF
jgi:hypothetical protein